MRGLIRIIPAAALLLAAWMSPFNDEVNAGNREYKNKNWSAAMEHYKKAGEHAGDDKECALADFNMGDAEYAQGNYERAVEYYNRSLKQGDPEIAKRSLFNMGNAYLKNGKKREAAESYAKALDIDPEYEKARKNLEYLQKQNDSDKNNKDKNKNSGNDKNNKDAGGGEKSGKGGMTPEQAARIFESMKDRPVRKKKGDRNGRRALEKYW
ncbi:MAG TPA: tetratricopeptide repeat protein [Spirochaetota bacterium]|nr:tetratricopeptide repeat protein [Spirochaetota bacterium]